MSLLSRSAVQHLITILVSVTLYHGLLFSPYIGDYMKQYSYLSLGIGVVFVLAAKRIAKLLAFLDAETAVSFSYIMAGIFILNGLIYIPQVLEFFRLYPLYIVGASVLLLMFKNKIADLIGG